MERIQKTHKQSTKEWLSYDSLWNNRKTGKFHGSFSVLAHDEKDMEQSVHFQLLYMREDLIQSLGWVTVPLPLRKLVKKHLKEEVCENFAEKCFNFMGSAK